MNLIAPSKLKLFHGTDDESITNILSFGVDLKRCSEYTDFGRGFYTTTNAEQAKNWGQLRAANRRKGKKKGAKGSVLALEIEFDWLANLESLAFVRDSSDCGFPNFVSYCRSGASPHRANSNYDVVYGPVALWQKGLDYPNSKLFTIGDCDQISFHNDAILTKKSRLFSNCTIVWKEP